MPLRDVTNSGRGGKKKKKNSFLTINLKKKKKTQVETQLWHLVLALTKEFHLHYWKSKFTMVTAS